jgi:hydroxymethylglutaryl-CoA synthase
VTDRIEEIRNGAPSVETLLADPIYINYATYARHKNKIKL